MVKLESETFGSNQAAEPLVSVFVVACKRPWDESQLGVTVDCVPPQLVGKPDALLQ